MKRRIFVVLAVGAVIAAAGWYYWQRSTAGANGDVVLYGNVDIRQVNLGFRVAGRIDAMRVHEGDSVAAGDMLATLDKAPFEDSVGIAEAEVAVQQAVLRKFRSGSRPAEIAQARALVAERRATLEKADGVLKRQESLLKRGHVSVQMYDDAVAKKMEAEAQLKSAQETLRLALEGFREEDVAAAEAQLKMAEARLAKARTDLADTQIFAPESGVILSRIEEPGAVVAAGAPVYTLSLLNPVWVRAYVSEPNLGRVRPGMKARVFTDSAPGRPYAGQVGYISPVAEFTPKNVETADLRTDLVYRVRIVVDDPEHGLRQGMPVTVRLPALRQVD